MTDDKWHALSWTPAMKPFRWDHAKNERLKLERQISFEEIALAIEDGGLLDVLQHRNAARDYLHHGERHDQA